MEQAQMQRKLDELGRIVLPIEMRQILNMQEKDLINIRLDGKKIILEKAKENKEEDTSKLSKIVVSKETLKKLGANDTKELEIVENNGQIILKKKEEKQETQQKK